MSNVKVVNGSTIESDGKNILVFRVPEIERGAAVLLDLSLLSILLLFVFCHIGRSLFKLCHLSFVLINML